MRAFLSACGMAAALCCCVLFGCSSEDAAVDPSASGGSSGVSSGGAGQCTDSELCDGLDNDCNGEVDEGCACIEGDSQPCYSGDEALIGIGACAYGEQICDIQGSWGACEEEVVASEEICDGADNDCNGETDEGFGSVTCGLGICQQTVEECVNGVPNPCVPGDPNPMGETCDTFDDDCDGDIDEDCMCANGQTQSCYGGSQQTREVGECKDGTQTCANGQFGACVGDTTPQPEVCDGLDNDCNGTPDDGNPGGGGACDTGNFGVCAAGIYNCVNGSLVCTQTLQPSAEVCDGLDNNCNNQTDEGNPGGGGSCNTGQLGICAVGTNTCLSGMLACVPNNTPQNETCNNQDDNCNGQTDEGNPGGGGGCVTGLNGVCNAGTLTCSAGMLSCVQNVQASNEVCDLLDNNCNGQTDEGFYGDTSNGNVDFDDVWSVLIPLMGNYITTNPTSGTVNGHILPMSDDDWFTIYAEEQKSDIITDTPIKGQVTITSAPGQAYTACVCWSDATTYCNKDAAISVPACVTSSGGPASLTAFMDMTITVTDTGYLDVQVMPLSSNDVSCSDWTVGWTVYE